MRRQRHQTSGHPEHKELNELFAVTTLLKHRVVLMP